MGFLQEFLDRRIDPKLRKVQLKRFLVTIDTNDVLAEDRKTISQRIKNLYDKEIPDDWDWSWQNNSGRMTKRIEKLCGVPAHNYDPSLTRALVNASSNLANMGLYVCDVSFDGFSWTAGAFGDGGSCYRHSTNTGYNRRTHLTDFGVGAFRIYGNNLFRTPSKTNLKTLAKNKNKLSGYGRAWIRADEPIPGAIIVHNAYPKGNIGVVYAQILSAMINQHVVKDGDNPYVTLKKYYSTGDESYLYMNSGGSGICVPENLVDKIPDYYVIDTNNLEI